MIGKKMYFEKICSQPSEQNVVTLLYKEPNEKPTQQTVIQWVIAKTLAILRFPILASISGLERTIHYFYPCKETLLSGSTCYRIHCNDFTIEATLTTNSRSADKRYMLYCAGIFQRKEQALREEALLQEPKDSKYASCISYDKDKKAWTQPSQALHLARDLNAHALVFNYPGIGGSQGRLSGVNAKKATQIMLRFLTEYLQAKQVIGYGYSMGGAVLGSALEGYDFSADTSYVFVMDRTVSVMSLALSYLLPLSGYLLRACGWELTPFAAIQTQQLKPIVLQTAKVERPGPITDKTLLEKHDDFVYAPASFAQKALEQKEPYPVIGITDRHFEDISNTSPLVQAVERAFSG